MRKIICILLAAMTAQIALAADTDDAIGLVEKYWEARNSKDYATQFDLMSEKGTLGANSNGTFFQDAERGTVEEMEEDLSNIANSLIGKHVTHRQRHRSH